MTGKNDQGTTHEVAGGQIKGGADAPIPTFLKLTYVGFCLFGLYYMVAYWAGETDHATRGTLVQEINKVMVVPGRAWLGFLFVILAVFVVGLLTFAFRSGNDEE